VTASIRDLEFHAELLELLGLEGQIDRDAVTILHMGYFSPVA
jgi:UV DNA damage repair endonuclease